MTFVGRRGAHVWLVLRGAVVVVLTLGLAGFRVREARRRWLWSAVRADGLPLEYEGDASSGLAEWLRAVALLAGFGGVLALALALALLRPLGLAGEAAAAAAAVAVAAVAAVAVCAALGLFLLWHEASDREYRLMLGRTRWRGVGFAVAPRGWGYARAALGHGLLTLLTLGLLWPRMTWALARHRIDRTSYGSAQLHLGGRWQRLYPAFLSVVLAALALAASGFATRAGLPQAQIVTLVAGLALLLAVLHYRIRSRRLILGAVTAGGLALAGGAHSGRVMAITLAGWLVTLAVVLAVILPLVPLWQMGALRINPADGQSLGRAAILSLWPFILGAIALVTLGLIAGPALWHLLVVRPLWREAALTTTVTGAQWLRHVRAPGGRP